jgi:hypothetical protein
MPVNDKYKRLQSSKTRALIYDVLPSDLVEIVSAYIMPAKRGKNNSKWVQRVIRSEHWELCMHLPDGSIEEGLREACRVGLLDMARLMLRRGAKEVNEGYKIALKGPHKDVIELMLTHGATPCACPEKCVHHVPRIGVFSMIASEGRQDSMLMATSIIDRFTAPEYW